jgi:hypothetical protein
MLRLCLWRQALAAFFVLGLIGHARADQPIAGAGPAPYGYAPGSESTAANPQPKQQRFGCWASHFGFGCGSFRSDMRFIFGSCRSFYGEACMKGPPPPYPPGSSQNGSGPNGGRGCGCP